jgi:hypothetical protein
MRVFIPVYLSYPAQKETCTILQFELHYDTTLLLFLGMFAYNILIYLYVCMYLFFIHVLRA